MSNSDQQLTLEPTEPNKSWGSDASASCLRSRRSEVRILSGVPPQSFTFNSVAVVRENRTTERPSAFRPFPTDSDQQLTSAGKQPRRELRFCHTCAEPFWVKSCDLERGQGRGTYCSRECRPVGMSDSATRSRARQIWIDRHNGAHPICRLCAKKADIHHKDENPLNNAPENHDPLCRSHHVSHEDTVHPRRRRPPLPALAPLPGVSL